MVSFCSLNILIDKFNAFTFIVILHGLSFLFFTYIYFLDYSLLSFHLPSMEVGWQIMAFRSNLACHLFL